MRKMTLLMLLAVLMTAACTERNTTTTTGGLSVEPMTIEIDSNGVAVTLTVDVPTNSALMQQSLTEYINVQLFFWEMESYFDAPTFNGDFKAYLNDCARLTWKGLEEGTFGDYPETVGPDDDGLTATEAREAAAGNCLTSGTVSFRLVYDTDSLASWQYEHDFYLAYTNHPSMEMAGITLRKDNGKLLYHDDLLRNYNSPEFHQLQKEALREWIATNWEVAANTDEELQGCLFNDEVENINELPLPEQNPFLTNEGIALPYESGELVQEACIITLPYEKVKPFMK